MKQLLPLAYVISEHAGDASHVAIGGHFTHITKRMRNDIEVPDRPIYTFAVSVFRGSFRYEYTHCLYFTPEGRDERVYAWLYGTDFDDSDQFGPTPTWRAKWTATFMAVEAQQSRVNCDSVQFKNGFTGGSTVASEFVAYGHFKIDSIAGARHAQHQGAVPKMAYEICSLCTEHLFTFAEEHMEHYAFRIR
jgi:hypothetical protein